MARGPQGQKRPADVIGAAVMVARIATGYTTPRRATGGRAARIPHARPRGRNTRAANRSPAPRATAASRAM